jgi:hypothetical protein
MTNDEVLDEISGFRTRLLELANMGSQSPWEFRWDVLRNDVEEFAGRTFASNSRDYQIIHGALHPSVVSLSGDKWREFLVNDYEPVGRALALVEHRLQQGQARLLEAAAEARLIGPRTPHSAYVLLREIVEGASQGMLIIDPYVDRSLFPLLSNVKRSIGVRILTRRQNVPTDFAEEAERFVGESGVSIQVRVGLDDFHDRFLVVDDRLFLSGASFKDLGKKGSVITEIADIKPDILCQLEQRWNSASALR